MIDNEEIWAIQQDGDKCKFGHYYRAINIVNKELKEHWDSVDDIHLELHKKSAELERAMARRDLNRARIVYSQAQKLSGQVLDTFRLISRKNREMDEKGQSVF